MIVLMRVGDMGSVEGVRDRDTNKG